MEHTSCRSNSVRTDNMDYKPFHILSLNDVGMPFFDLFLHSILVGVGILSEVITLVLRPVL